MVASFQCVVRKRITGAGGVDPFRTAAPFRGQTTYALTELSPKRDCGTVRVQLACSVVW